MREWEGKNRKRKLMREKKMTKWLFITYFSNWSFSAHVPHGSQAHPHHKRQIFCVRGIWFWFVKWLARIRWFGIVSIIWICLGEWGGWFNVVVPRSPRHTYSNFLHTLVIELISFDFVHTLIMELISNRNTKCHP